METSICVTGQVNTGFYQLKVYECDNSCGMRSTAEDSSDSSFVKCDSLLVVYSQACWFSTFE